MAQRGKRKARSNVSLSKAPQGKRRINLNGISSQTGTDDLSESPAPSAPHPQGGEESSDLPTSLETSALSSSSLGTAASTSSNKSTFSLPFFPFTSSSPAPLNERGDPSPSFLSRLKRYLPERPRKKMKMEASTSSEGKGKERAVGDYDERGNINADESARMIELLDSPVSVQPWHLHPNGVRDREESVSVDSVENLLQDDGGAQGQEEVYLRAEEVTPGVNGLYSPGSLDEAEEALGVSELALSPPGEEGKTAQAGGKEAAAQSDGLRGADCADEGLDKDVETEVHRQAEGPTVEGTASGADMLLDSSLTEESKEETGQEVEPAVVATLEQQEVEPAAVATLEEQKVEPAAEAALEGQEEELAEQTKDEVEWEAPHVEKSVQPLEDIIAGDLDISISHERVDSDNGIAPPGEEMNGSAVVRSEEDIEKPEVRAEEAAQQEANEVPDSERREDVPEHEGHLTSTIATLLDQRGTDEHAIEDRAATEDSSGVEGQGDGERREGREESDADSEEEDDIILLPTTSTAETAARMVAERGDEQSSDVIDLTDSPEAEPEKEEGGAHQLVAPVPPVLHRPSELFANGILAREKRLPSFQLGSTDSHGSASRIIHQLGQRQMSVSRSPSKTIPKPSTGFRKRDPIFNKARKSLAKDIAMSKADDLLTSLKRNVKKAFHMPHIDGMLKKKVALSRILAEDAPAEEVQIRHLRDIIKRSESKYRSSLRPARRLLKEQERLAHEAKLLQRRALGILGRSPLPVSLSDEQEDSVRQTFQKQGKIAQIPGAGVESRDVAKLRPGQWLNDEVINFYTKLILNRSDEAAKKRAGAREAKKRLEMNSYDGKEEERTDDIMAVRDGKRVWNGIWNVWVFTSFFYEKLSKGGYSGVRQWTRKVDIFTKDLVLLPINMGQMHWVCAAINMRQCRFEYYDSMHSPNPKVFAVLRSYLQEEYADKKKGAPRLDLDGWKNYFSRQSPAQSNGFDCGVFATMTLEQVSRRNPIDGDLNADVDADAVVRKSRKLAEGRQGERNDGSDSDSDGDDDVDEEWNFSQADMPYLRRRMVYEIASANLLNE